MSKVSYFCSMVSAFSLLPVSKSVESENIFGSGKSLSLKFIIK